MSEGLSSVCKNLDKANRIAGISPETLLELRYPKETLSASIPFRRNDGSLEMVKAWRCRHNDLMGPTKGGIRFHPSSNLDHVMTLAFFMTFKCALFQLPYGGAKGAASIDFSMLNDSERETFTRQFVQAFDKLIHPERDVPAPDVGTNGEPIGWMLEELGNPEDDTTKLAFTGKPLASGGSRGREKATGYGGTVALRKILNLIDFKDKNIRVAIQGFGNAGSAAAIELARCGFDIVAISDSKAMIHSQDGLDPSSLYDYKTRSGSLAGYDVEDGIRQDDPEEIIASDCDVLILAALQDAIVTDQTESVKARIILELANGPITTDVDEQLTDNGVIIIPDILANAGGVVASHLELTQNRANERWGEADVLSRVANQMSNCVDEVWNIYSSHECSIRTACYARALSVLQKCSEENRD